MFLDRETFAPYQNFTEKRGNPRYVPCGTYAIEDYLDIILDPGQYGSYALSRLAFRNLQPPREIRWLGEDNDKESAR